MSRFSSAFIFASSLAFSSLGAPLAFAQAATSHATPPMARTHIVQAAANTCFTEDLVPGDDSSMLKICGTAPTKIIFTE